MNILMSGSHGFIARELMASLQRHGHTVRRLVRERQNQDECFWNPYSGEIDQDALGGIDAVIHLAGESIAEGRWTPAKKKRILESRTIPTRFLAGRLAQTAIPPSVFVCASAIGFYGDRGEEVLTEKSSPGSGFLARVCSDWEAATAPAAAKGIRVVNVRFGLILSESGGALAKLLLPFKLGVGGRLGSGDQFWSWITLDDVIGSIEHVLGNNGIDGPVNVVSLQAVPNREFTRILGKVMSRPTLFPAPAAALRLALGEMADALLLSSANVKPVKLVETEYRFRQTELVEAFRFLLNGKI